jgi:hypothetical protein
LGGTEFVDDLRESLEDDVFEATLPGLPTGAVITSEGLNEFPLERPPTGLATPGETGRVIQILPWPDEVPENGSDLALFLPGLFGGGLKALSS